MKRDLKSYKGLYGDQQAPYPEYLLHWERLATRSDRYGWQIEQHFHADLYQLFIFSRGGGTLFSEQQHLLLRPPCVLLIPANHLHGFVFEAATEGEVLTFSESTLEYLLGDVRHVLLAVSQLRLLDFDASGAAFEEVSWLKERIVLEIHEARPEKLRMLQHLAQLLFLSLYRTSQQAKKEQHQPDNRSLAHFRAFQQLIRQSVAEPKSIQHYARTLAITSVHLNRICQEIAQKSALQVVHEFLVAEARKYLLHTPYSLSEISDRLGFRDPAYFSRLFKKQTAFSPRAYRQQHLDGGPRGHTPPTVADHS